MKVDFKIEYQPKDDLLRLVSKTFETHWIKPSKESEYNEPLKPFFYLNELGLGTSSCSIDHYEDYFTLSIVLIKQYGKRFYKSSTQYSDDKEKVIFNNFNEFDCDTARIKSKVDDSWEKSTSSEKSYFKLPYHKSRRR